MYFCIAELQIAKLLKFPGLQLVFIFRNFDENIKLLFLNEAVGPQLVKLKKLENYATLL